MKMNSIKRAVFGAMGLAMVLSIGASAQELQRSEVSVQGAGFFTRHSDGNGIQNTATKSGGFLLGYRYNVNRWLAAEGDYGYTRNTQFYSGPTPAAIRTDIHEITGSAVVKLPGIGKLRPFVLGGGGVLVFNPTNEAGISFAGAVRENKGTFVYGGGADYDLTSHLALRAEYRGLVYKGPSFQTVSLDNNSWTHVAQPAAGVVFKF